MARRPCHSRVTTWVLLGLYGLVASGLPLPFGLPAGGDGPRAGSSANGPAGKAAAIVAAKDRSRAFPCMDKPCGCGTAEQCFSHCCCHTPAERLAWARAHQVEPAVLAALERRVAVEIASPPAAEASCCTAAAAACCDTAVGAPPQANTAAVGEPPQANTAAAGAPPTEDHGSPVREGEPRRLKTLSLRAMLACSGLVAEWYAAGGGGALPPPRVGLVLDAGLVATAVGGDELPLRLAVPPDVPPPRCA